MTVAGFSKTRDPKVSFFLGRPRQGLSPGWHPSPLPSYPEIGFDAFPLCSEERAQPARCSIDLGPGGWRGAGGVGWAGDSLGETHPSEFPLSLSPPLPCTSLRATLVSRGPSGVGLGWPSPYLPHQPQRPTITTPIQNGSHPKLRAVDPTQPCKLSSKIIL